MILSGKRLDSAMKRRGVSIKALAMAAGVSRQAIRLYLRGERQPRAGTFIDMCVYLRVNPLNLMVEEKKHE